MEAAFERLTAIQQISINKEMFVFAYNCVVKSKGNHDALVDIVSKEAAELRPDIMRYCRLVQRVM